MLSRIAVSVVSLAVLLLGPASCGDGRPEPAPTSTPTAVQIISVPVPVLTPTPVSSEIATSDSRPAYPTEEIPPCTPLPGSVIDPCDPNAPPLDMGTAQYVPDLDDEPITVREMLDDEPPPAWVTHVVLRATYLPGTVRCTAGDRFRPPPYLSDEFVYTANSRAFKCYVDVRANAYVLGSGPSTLTAMVFKYLYFDGEYRPQEEGQTEQDVIEEVRQQFETSISDFFPGKENIIFLGPPVDLSSEVWRLLGFWDVQRRGWHSGRRPSSQRPLAAPQTR